MGTYFDTSVLVKFYVPEIDSGKYLDFLRGYGKAIFINRLHELEFSNALSFKAFRGEISILQVDSLVKKFESDIESGKLVRRNFSWNEIFDRSSNISIEFSSKIGSRILDILHVAAAVSGNFKQFMTNDEKQSILAVNYNLDLIKL